MFEWTFPRPPAAGTPIEWAFHTEHSDGVVRSVEAKDAGLWPTLRARLWPDAVPEELAREVRTFLSGRAVPTLAAAFVAQLDHSSDLVGFLELGLRPFSDGCDSMPIV